MANTTAKKDISLGDLQDIWGTDVNDVIKALRDIRAESRDTEKDLGALTQLVKCGPKIWRQCKWIDDRTDDRIDDRIEKEEDVWHVDGDNKRSMWDLLQKLEGSHPVNWLKIIEQFFKTSYVQHTSFPRHRNNRPRHPGSQ